MAISKIDAIRQLMAVRGKEQARLFCELVPQVENDDDLFELLGMFPASEVSEETRSLAWLLMSLVTYKRKMETDLAYEFQKGNLPRKYHDRFPWLVRGVAVPSVDDVLEREQFRQALIALARSALAN